MGSFSAYNTELLVGNTTATDNHEFGTTCPFSPITPSQFVDKKVTLETPVEMETLVCKGRDKIISQTVTTAWVEMLACLNQIR